MLKWNLTVCNSLILKIGDLMGDDLPSDKLEELKELCLNRLFQRGKINMILDKFKKTIDTKVLIIPSDFVLGEDVENAKFADDELQSEAQDEKTLLESIMEKRAKVLQLRIEIETLKKLQDICSGT